jgi:hypothetical protein
MIMSHVVTHHHTRPKTLDDAQRFKRYWNKIGVQTFEGVYTTESSDRAIELFNKFERKYPGSPPVIGFIPPGDAVMVPTYLRPIDADDTNKE